MADNDQCFFFAVTTTAPTGPVGTPPTSGGFIGMYVTHPGLALTGQTTLAVNLGMDADFTLKGSVTPTTPAIIA